jgi:Uncharacterized protein conserved in bacteria (DUF2252)
MSIIRRAKFVGLLIALLAFPNLSACKFGTDSGLGSDVRGKAEQANLPDAAVLNREYFAGHALGISPDVFAKRWQNSLSSPLVFFRSHVRAYYAITKALPLPSSKIGVCFGGAKLLYNDLDDSGNCPVLLDALRYFTSVRFLEGSSDVGKQVDLYTGILEGKEDSAAIKKRFIPDFQRTRKDVLERYRRGDRIVREPGKLEDVAPQIAQDISKLVEGVLVREGITGQVLDVALASGHGGGSFGLVRYWALVRSGDDDIIEVKESAEPATAIGGWGSLPGERLETLKKIFWGGHEAVRVYREAQYQGKVFIVRSRVKASLDPEEFGDRDRKAIYATQVSILADLHRQVLGSISGTDSSAIGEWLRDYSKEVSELYQKVYKAAR